jgi:hypothetical protein
MTMEALGVDFGDYGRFYEADQWNKKGYYERTDVININNQLLTGLPRTEGPARSALSHLRYVLMPETLGIVRRANKLRDETERSH